MGFNNPLTGENGSLIYQQIKSPNFNLALQTGWAILKNGNAYFFNVTATGTITATTFAGTDFIINSSGAFFYSGTPAAGNLILALASVAGSDAFGNTYAQGLTLGAAGTNKQIVLGINAGSPLIYFLSAIATALNNAAFQLNNTGAGSAIYDTLVLKGSQETAFPDYAAINLVGSSHDGVTQVAMQSQAYVDTAGTPHFYQTLGLAGAALIGLVTGVQPGTGLTRTNVAVAETWHAATAATGWSTAGLTPPMAYTLNADNTVSIEGMIKFSAGTPASGATMFTLPVGYRPVTGKFYLTPTASDIFLVSVGPTGGVTISNWAGFVLGVTPNVYIQTRYSLGV
jgi:hypothetical protein